MPHIVTFVVFPQFEMLDLSGPCAAFHLVNELAGLHYHIQVVSTGGGWLADRCGLGIQTEPITQVPECHTLMAVGGPTAHSHDPQSPTSQAVRQLAQNAKRLASVCTGAFLLASAGLLDGKRATTHWRYAGLMQKMYPKVHLCVDRIFIQDGPVWTAAGMSAGIDLALALIERDLGADLAGKVARDMVVYHRRLGGQSQFSALLDMAPSSGRVSAALTYARTHLNRDVSVEQLAEVAGISLRQFNRVFVKATGTTPAKAILHLKLEMAKPRIEDDIESFELIAHQAGFGSAEKMCRTFLAVFGRTPQELRRTARSHKTSMPDAVIQ